MVFHFKNKLDNWNVGVINADGSNLTNISNPSSEYYHPEWSPDGSEILFSASRDRSSDLYIMDQDGNNERLLIGASTIGRDPTFSPNGDKIAYFGPTRRNQNEITVMNIDGTNSNEISDITGLKTDLSWNTYGNLLAFVFKKEIYTINADGTNMTRLTFSENMPNFDEKENYNNTPNFSPDGSKIVFTSLESGTSQIYTMNINGSNRTRITNNQSYYYGSDWSPDGSKIVTIAGGDILIIPLEE